MKFYNRESELSYLQEIKKRSLSGSKMSVVIGRRRIGKTTLIKKAFSSGTMVYLFVSKKSEALLCEEYISIIQDALGVKIIGKILHFRELFEYLMQLGREKSFTLILDEFQEFYSINKSIYSDMQNIWDSYKDETKVNLILSGSIYSIMKKIFENSKEPLFGRADERILLKPFKIDTLKKIMDDFAKDYSADDFLSFYILTGGVAKYVEIFVDNRAFTLQDMLNLIFKENSLLLDEGKNLLIEEFGKEYSTYFSILALIGNSNTSRAEIEGILGKNVGGYLDRLEKEYTIIKKIKPIFAKEGSRSVKYEIIDNFFNFWFRFIYKYKSAIEIENFDYVKSIVLRDYATYSGKFLEKIFIEKLKDSKKYSQIGTYWERGNKNEIDIVAVDDLNKEVLIAEVKRNSKKININELKKKALKIEKMLKGYKFIYRGFGLEEVLDF